ncbi:hypothetical protein STAS_20696 [Striga asiatica]|uniref:Uncharacterized protein n=1 Tax=Striga asiatica TaxID=4170 RepID=A0A5A7QFL8_STRAF|nr:hypothetical protein STAS_20696 [Striga asiatica]
MRERGKEAAIGCEDFNFCASSEMPCPKHPIQSAVGICPYCLKDRLLRLVCSDCGEQRLSSCSCSDGVSSSSHRNSYCSAVEVGRVSFLIENDRNRDQKPPPVIFLRRSTSSCVEVRRSGGLWRIKRLFRRKKSKHADGGDDDGRSEIWVPEAMGISRSRSVCSFRDDESRSAFSSAKISDVTSGVFTEPRKSDFRGVDESAFIDLRVDLSEFCGPDRGGGGEGPFDQLGYRKGCVGGIAAAAAAAEERERGVMKKKKSRKVWRWILKYHPAAIHHRNNN